jgi:hypothetical protein
MLRWLVLTLLYRSAASQLVFSAGFSDDAVLQRSANSGAVVYGFATTNDPVTLTLTGGDPQKVAATVTPWVHSACGAVNDTKTPCPAPPHGPFVWRGVLKPQPKAGGSYTLTVSTASAGSNSTITLQRLTYGDVSTLECCLHRFQIHSSFVLFTGLVL